MFKSKRVKDAVFYRSSNIAGIDVFLPDVKRPIFLSNPIKTFTKILSERELEETIEILSHKAKVKIKQRNFPLIYEEMLSELKDTLEERYR